MLRVPAGLAVRLAGPWLAVVLTLAACADEPTTLDAAASASSSTGAGAGSGAGGDGTGGALADAQVLIFGAEEDAVAVESENDDNPSSVAPAEARLFILPVTRDCPSGVSTCLAFSRSDTSSPTRLEVRPEGLLVHVFAGEPGNEGDVTFDADEVSSPGGGRATLHYRTYADFVDYGVLDQVGAFSELQPGLNQVDLDDRFARYDDDEGIVRVDLPEPLEDGGRYAMVVGEEPEGHWVTYCKLQRDEEACETLTSDVGPPD